MDDTAIQFIAILITVAGLLGWLLKQVITYFISTSAEKIRYIETLVSQNQKNTESFVNTINHQRTLDREMQEKHLCAIRELRDELRTSNKVNTEVLKILTNKSLA